MLAEIRGRSQITIPAEIVRKLGISEGDKFEVMEKDGGIFLCPVVVYPKEKLTKIAKIIKDSEEDIADVINDDRNEWDQDWTESKSRKFYSKNTDRVLLYRRIRYHAKDYMAEYREIHNIYKDVFAALKNGSGHLDPAAIRAQPGLKESP